MSGGATTVTLMSTVGDELEPVALTVTFSIVPTVAVVPAVIVTVDMPLSVVIDVGMNDAVRPVGAVAVSVAFSAMPAVLVSLTVVVALPPTGTSSVVGVAAMVKSLMTTFGSVAMQSLFLFDHSFCTV